MRRFGINILLVGFLTLGLGGAGYLLPFLMSFDEAGVQAFDTVVLSCWGIGAALILIGAGIAAIGKASSRS